MARQGTFKQSPQNVISYSKSLPFGALRVTPKELTNIYLKHYYITINTICNNYNIQSNKHNILLR